MNRSVATSRRHEAGFSLIEGLIAAVILLFVILGILPLMSRAMANNLAGNDASIQNNASVDGTERLISLPFNAPDLTIDPGVTSRLVEQVYSLERNQWIDKTIFESDSEYDADTAQFTRSGTIEQFNALEFDDGDPDLDTPLDGSTDPGSVHLKRIRMEIQNERLLLTGSNSGNFRVVVVHTY